MASTTYYLTDSAHLESIEIKLGNLLFCEDTKRIYYDNENRRVCYDSIMVFETEAERELYANPFEGFYFVSETKVLWRYEGNTWYSITEPPVRNVVFTPKEELPEQGKYAVLYVCDREFYVWNPTTRQYEGMTAESVWHEV